MKELLLAMLVLTARACMREYTCGHDATYSWCSDEGTTYAFRCPPGMHCQTDEPTKFPYVPPLPRPLIAQMVMLTWDDAITPTTHNVVSQIVNAGHINPNGCPIRTTWFVSLDYTVPELLQDYVRSGQEIADHTEKHTPAPGVKEIEEGRRLLAEFGQSAGLAREDIVGFRAPNLHVTPWTFEALHALGFSYDCSVPEQSHAPYSSSPSTKVWPYTLDYGHATICHIGLCNYTAAYPGLWSIPMYTVDEIDPASAWFGSYAVIPYFYGAYMLRVRGVMDLPFAAPELERLLMGNFLAHYNGNRAPFGIYLHPAWLLADVSRISWLNHFISRLLAMPDVWLVSGTGKTLCMVGLMWVGSDVISYMKEPVSSGQAVPFTCPGQVGPHQPPSRPPPPSPPSLPPPHASPIPPPSPSAMPPNAHLDTPSSLPIENTAPITAPAPSPAVPAESGGRIVFAHSLPLILALSFYI